MAQKTYGIDFGTGTIKIYKKGNGIVILERNVVSTVGKENKPIAIGETAYEMYEKDGIEWLPDNTLYMSGPAATVCEGVYHYE